MPRINSTRSTAPARWMSRSGGLRFVQRNMRMPASKDAGREDRPQYSLRAVFEALVNAVAHRDYAIYGARMRLHLYADRLELASPGALPNTLDVEGMALRESTRNELVASLLARCPTGLDEAGRARIMDIRGEGVPLILRESLALAGRRPQYRLVGEELQLTIWAAMAGYVAAIRVLACCARVRAAGGAAVWVGSTVSVGNVYARRGRATTPLPPDPLKSQGCAPGSCLVASIPLLPTLPEIPVRSKASCGWRSCSKTIPRSALDEAGTGAVPHRIRQRQALRARISSIETRTDILMIEPKRADQIGLPEVQAKARAATRWCHHASEHAAQHGSKPWRYLLVPDTAIDLAQSVAGLRTRWTWVGGQNI
ncbi:ATP-binding protein [Plasticicumulans sp.]|uniref:ATP-binding protein n=1 Tax=Plasticicumulans sp. TaxID=2307179 RepID=UPI00394DA931